MDVIPDPCAYMTEHLCFPGGPATPVVLRYEHRILRSTAPALVAPASTACHAPLRLLITHRQKLAPACRQYSERLRVRSIPPLQDCCQNFGKGTSAFADHTPVIGSSE
jgi:hypothetical protein